MHAYVVDGLNQVGEQLIADLKGVRSFSATAADFIAAYTFAPRMQSYRLHQVYHSKDRETMATSLLKRLVAKATLAAFIGSQLTGCLTVPNNTDMATMIRSAGQMAGAGNGSTQAQADALGSLAKALGDMQSTQPAQTQGTQSPSAMLNRMGVSNSAIGNPSARYNNPSYTSAEFQGIYNRFKSTKAVMEANPRGFSQQQFFAFSGALANMMRYIDAIGMREEGRASLHRPAGDQWADFYAESMAEAEPVAQGGITMGDGIVNAQIDSSRMVAQGYTPAPGDPVFNPPVWKETYKPTAKPQQQQKTAAQRLEEAQQSLREAEEVEAAVKEDLKDLASKEVFNQFLDKDTPLLKFMTSKFTSNAAQQVLTSIPVVGNILNLAMLASGKNLDGSDMDGIDYAVAAIGVLPVAGNIASKFGPLLHPLANELKALGQAAKARPQIEYGLEAIGSEMAEVAMNRAQPAMDAMYETIAETAVRHMPQTVAYAKQNNIKI